MKKRVDILVGLFLLSLFFVSGFTYASSQLEEPFCGDGICEEAEKYCSSSYVNCDDINNCVATADCGPTYCPDDCTASVDELDKCRRECKSTCEDEKCRSKCIKECKPIYDFNDDLKCLPCGDSCAPYDVVVVAECTAPTKEFECGVRKGECIILEDKIFKEYEDAKLEVNAGTTPDNALYFLDKFLDNFGDDIKVKEERVAEIKTMIEAGNYEGAKKALKEYLKLAEKLKQEIGPNERGRALKSAAAIRNAIRDIKEQLPEEERNDFIGIIEKEISIATSAEIASKINNLCRELSALDPTLFYESCKTGDEGPKWQKEMYKKLTKEQEEAKNFAKIMKQCFKTSGQDCKCEEIPYEDFSNACSTAAPLATACDIDGDTEACKRLDDLNMPKLPPHLQNIMNDLDDMDRERYDMHMPEECQKEGVKDPNECGRIMIEKNSPPECKDALLEANVKSEREGRKICDAIMMNIHAPECAEEGITDPEECKDFMWNMDRRPAECQENDIHDFRDCKIFLAQEGRHDKGSGPRMDFNCREIEEPMERLECYDGASSSVKGYKDVKNPNYDGLCMTPDDWDAKKKECRNLYGENAGDEPIMGSSGEGYECAIDTKCIDFGNTNEEDYDEWEDWGDGNYEESECKDGCQDECPGASRTDCVDGGTKCECFYEDDTEYSSDVENSENEELDSSEEDESENEEESSEDSEESGNQLTGNFFLNYWFN
jgi:hypothetical protein